jgi:nucleoside-diphosphate-sugar epimerase
VKPGRRVTRVVYPGRRDAGHAWAYLPDLAETVARLVERRHELSAFESLHFRGHWLPRGVAMAETICDVAGLPRTRIGTLPWFALRMLAPFVEQFRELHEMRYLWDATVELDNARLLRLLGTEPHTELRAAVEQTLASLGCLDAHATEDRCAC